MVVPKQLLPFLIASNIADTKMKPESPSSLNLSKETPAQYISFIESLREYVGSNLSYGIIYESAVFDGTIKQEDDLLESFKNINLNFKRIKLKRDNDDQYIQNLNWYFLQATC